MQGLWALEDAPAGLFAASPVLLSGAQDVKRIESWLNTRILELRGKIQQLKRMKPSNRIGERLREYQLARARSSLTIGSIF
jgi:hypothetical protein